MAANRQLHTPHVILLLLMGVLLGFGIGFAIRRPVPEPPAAIVVEETPQLTPVGPFGVPSPTEDETDTPTPIGVLLFPVSSQWKLYDKEFQHMHFTFRYPPGVTIQDGDEDSGDIYLFAGSNRNEPAVSIGRLSYYGFPEYDSGSRRLWFERAYRQYSGQDQVSLAFEEVNFANGARYLRVISRVDDVLHGFLSAKNNFYVGVFNGHAVMFRDTRQLSRDTVMTILQTLSAQ